MSRITNVANSVPLNGMQKCLKHYYENGNHTQSLPLKLFRELEKKSIILSEADIKPEEVVILCRFLQHSITKENVVKIVLTKSTTDTLKHAIVKKQSGKEFAPLSANGSKLMRIIFDLILKSSNLETVIIQNLELDITLVESLGKSVSETSSGIRNFQLKSCGIGGDTGFNVLAPYLARMDHMNICILERLSLTDASGDNLTALIKTQEAAMDTLFWNATLRVQPPSAISTLKKTVQLNASASGTCSPARNIEVGNTRCCYSVSKTNAPSVVKQEFQNKLSSVVIEGGGTGSLWHQWIPDDDENCKEDVKVVYSSGLVLLSLNGNKFTEAGISGLCKNMRDNHWILGLNLANNCISDAYVRDSIIPNVLANNVLHTIVLGGNPGYDVTLCRKLKNRMDKCESRLEMLPEEIRTVLSRWKHIQNKESRGNGVSLKIIGAAVSLANQQTATIAGVGDFVDGGQSSSGSDDESGSRAGISNRAHVYDVRRYANEPHASWSVTKNMFGTQTVHGNLPITPPRSPCRPQTSLQVTNTTAKATKKSCVAAGGGPVSSGVNAANLLRIAKEVEQQQMERSPQNATSDFVIRDDDMEFALPSASADFFDSGKDPVNALEVDEFLGLSSSQPFSSETSFSAPRYHPHPISYLTTTGGVCVESGVEMGLDTKHFDNERPPSRASLRARGLSSPIGMSPQIRHFENNNNRAATAVGGLRDRSPASKSRSRFREKLSTSFDVRPTSVGFSNCCEPVRHSLAWPMPSRAHPLGPVGGRREPTLVVAFGRSRSTSSSRVRNFAVEELRHLDSVSRHSESQRISKKIKKNKPKPYSAKKKNVPKYDLTSNTTRGNTRMHMRNCALSSSPPQNRVSAAISSSKMCPGSSTNTTSGNKETESSLDSKKCKKRKQVKKRASRSNQELYSQRLSMPAQSSETPIKSKSPSPVAVFMSPASKQLELQLGKAVKMLTKHIDVVSTQLNRASGIIAETTSLNASIQQRANDISTESFQSPPQVSAVSMNLSNMKKDYRNEMKTTLPLHRKIEENGQVHIESNANVLSEKERTTAENDVLLNQLIQNKLYVKIAEIYNDA